jgi:uncharacterized protein (DUF885 family)
MRTPTTVVLLAILGIGLCSNAIAAADSAARELHALFDDAWEHEMREDPLRASDLGDHRYDALWPDMSNAAIQRRHEADEAILARLDRIDRNALSVSEQLNYDLFAYGYTRRVKGYPFKPWLYDLQAQDGIQSLATTGESLPFATVKDYENWIARLRSIDRYIEEQAEQFRIGIRERRVQPKGTMERVEASLKTLIATDDPTQSPFYRPFLKIPESIAPEARERLQAQGKLAIKEVVNPAYKRFEKFFRTAYLPHSRTTPGIWDTPAGDAFYRERISFFTTTSLTPDAIHEIGLQEVARIRGQIEDVMRQLGFKGSYAEFLAFMRTDPQFYYGSADELFRAYVMTTKQVEPELVKLFRVLPRTPLGVRAVPDEIAPNTPTAYYMVGAADGSRAGYYYVNLYRYETRPKYAIEVLTAHEAVPGHHLQIALGKELKDLPAFRRDARNVAFSEGWALYAEGLGERLGLYKDLYSKYGQLDAEIWRAVRLVLDTGIHYKHWDRSQAVEYFKANTSISAQQIETEVSRYIDWPGQALSYKTGQLRILELRHRAESALGSRFDIRDFHDVVLCNGPLPLDVLDSLINRWIAAGDAADAERAAICGRLNG